MHRLIALVIVASGGFSASNVAGPGGLRLLVRDTPDLAVTVDIMPAMTSDGVNTESVRAQTELALRRCGFVTGSGPKAKGMMSVIINGLSQEGRGYSASVHVEVVKGEYVRGEFVFVEVWTNGMVLAGPPGDAPIRVRNVMAELLDQFCNLYLEARDEVRGKSGK